MCDTKHSWIKLFINDQYISILTKELTAIAYNLQAKNVIGFPPLRHDPGVFELSVTMQLLHERKESTSNCFFFKIIQGSESV